MQLRSFKLRFADTHVRVVPATDAQGCPFSGPGVDLRGDAAAAALSLAAPLLALLAEVEPGIRVRSIAVDLERPRVTATLEGVDASATSRPRVVRLDEGAVLQRLIAASAPLCDHLAAMSQRALAQRAAPSTAQEA